MFLMENHEKSFQPGDIVKILCDRRFVDVVLYNDSLGTVMPEKSDVTNTTWKNVLLTDFKVLPFQVHELTHIDDCEK